MRLTAPETGALLGALLSFALASEPLTLYLPAKPNPFTLPPSTHATLSSSGAHYSAPLSSANTFVFRNVTPGSYLADVHAPTDAFHPLRIDVQVVEGAAEHDVVQAWETFRGNDWGNKGEVVPVREGSKGRGFEVRAIGSKSYFMERPQCESWTEHLRCWMRYTNSVTSSLRPFYPQEPHDPHGSRQSGSVGRHAQTHGQQYVAPSPFHPLR